MNRKLVIGLVLGVLTGFCLFGFGNREDSFEYSGIRKISVTDGGVFHFVISGESSRSKVSGKVSASSKSNLTFHPVVRDGVLYLEAEKEFLLFPDDSGEHYVELFVPLLVELEIKTQRGDITLNRCHGTKDLETVSGNIFIEKSDGRMDLMTASGDIFVSDSIGTMSGKSRSGGLNVQFFEGFIGYTSHSGSIEAMRFKGAVDLKTISGGISLKEVRFNDHSQLSSGTGQLDLILVDGAVDLEIVAESRFSEIFFNDQGQGSSFFREGTYPVLNLKSDSGRIAIFSR